MRNVVPDFESAELSDTGATNRVTLWDIDVAGVGGSL
jgi:hypothetical protein